MNEKAERKRNRIIALILFVASFATYLKTVAPTVPFWDCGEFIATSHIMGVPHPPGAPLFILVGRFFILIFSFVREIALRVNLISVLFCALAVTFFYLCIIRIMSLWLKPIDSTEKRIILYTGGIVSSLFMAFSDTFWFNATEAEVYGIAMFFTCFVCWLILVWAERYKERDSDRFLFLIVYLLFLGITNHMTVFLVAPPVFLYVVLTDKEKLYDWKFWTLGVLLVSVLFSIEYFFVWSLTALAVTLILIVFNPQQIRLSQSDFVALFPIAIIMIFVGLKIQPNSQLGSVLQYLFHAGIALFFIALVMLLKPQQAVFNCKYMGVAFLIALVGYSTYVYIPIRAKRSPAINENNPDNWERYKMFMERKQYGQESMTKRMFNRRGSWANQFGDHRRMGFWYFFKNQYFSKDVWFFPGAKTFLTNIGEKIPLILGLSKFFAFFFWLSPVFLGLFGMFYHLMKEQKTAFFTISLFLTASLLLLIYINFSDGTRSDHLEVRDRDYFYTQAYAFFPMWLGIGAAGLLEWIRSQWKVKKAGLSLGAFLFIAFSTVPLFHNYHEHDRTGDYIAHDYAYNILISCDPDAILFTNGDNDTFPLWFLQEVKRIRKDVRVVNLSLLNTDWYVKQLRDKLPKVPLGNITDERLEQLVKTSIRGMSEKDIKDRFFCEWDIRTMGIKRIYETRKETRAGITWDLKPSRKVPVGGGQQVGFLTVQDWMVREIIGQNNWQRPIYFAVTVSPENKINLDEYLRMEGLVLRLVREKGSQQLDPARSLHNLWDLYLYRGVNDPNVYKDEQTKKLLSNYQASYVYLAQVLMQEGKNEEAVKQMERLNELVPPDDWKASLFQAQIFTNMGRYAEAAEHMKKTIEMNPEFTQGKLNLPLLLERAGKVDSAIRVYNDLIEEEPNLGQAYTGLGNLYARRRDYSQAVDVLRSWLARSPNDAQAQEKLKEYEQALQGLSTTTPDTVPQ